MKRIFTLCVLICTTLIGFTQVDSTKKENKADTIRIGGMVIIRDRDSKNRSIDRDTIPKWRNRHRDKRSNTSTNWWILDLGFSNYADNTDYTSADAIAYAGPGVNGNYFALKNWKSRNVNIWFFMQRLNIVKHAVNLKYGLGLELNNYHYKSNLRYIEDPAPVANPQRVMLDVTPNRSYKKTKLAADYLTVPVMLNINFTPEKDKGYGFSFGISAGYLYSARNKTVTSDEGKEKAKDDFGQERWKLSYVGEVALGPVRFYGSYAFKNMYEKGLDMTPYTFGLRFSNW